MVTVDKASGSDTGQKSFRRKSLADRVLSAIIVVAILASIGALGYVMAVPRLAKFTEFYLLGTGGKAADYLETIAPGSEGKVIVGITNREQETVTYRVEVKVDGTAEGEIGQIALEAGQDWRQVVSFRPDRAGDNQKVEFLLYRQGQIEPYRSVYLLIDVR